MSQHPPDDEKPEAATLERLRAAFRADDAEAAGGESVDADRVWRAVNGELSPEERRAVVERVAADPAWATAWRLAMAMSRAATEATPEAKPAPVPRLDTAARREPEGRRAGGRRFRFAWSRPAWGALAAAAAAVLVVVGVSLRPGTDDAPRFRGGETAAIVSQVAEGAPLARDRFVLRWAGGPEGTRWTLQLSSEDLGVVHRAESLARGEYQVPREVLAPLPPGAKVLWQVEARLPDGRVRRSATFVNRVE